MSKLRGLPQDDTDVRFSKTLAYLLRHGAEKHGLPMRKDGFVRVSDLLQEPTLKTLTFPHLRHLVESNAKKRFVLFYGVDPSPNRPERRKKQQGKTKKTAASAAAAEQEIHPETEAGEELPLLPIEPPQVPPYPAAQSSSSSQPSPPPPQSSTPPAPASNPAEGEWFIRAAQGHSIQTVTTEHLDPITQADEAGLQKVGEMVHGTKSELWESIHVLTSTGTIHSTLPPSSLAGPRANSTLYIYLSLPTLLSRQPEPVPVFVSTNNVILTPGDSNGVIPASMFHKVVRLRRELPDRTAAISAGQGPEEAESGVRGQVAPTVGDEAQEPGQAQTQAQAEQTAKPKRDRKNREKPLKPTFIEEIIWEDGVVVDPPQRVE
ncbi:hypothetical protein QFC22_005453 [Naganishia vaughanmartiniae]|uniref:Uncharacterized protein n=1 Tax=Naganishia vaughanmartiniae TaxID=1424756 RepID=A0ACC2WUE7_9TREE|nr:hypothetical protein QFC22_005453 [Naganishia vaughanmartiniae]